MLREAFDPQTVDVFEMPAIIGQESEAVPPSGNPDQQIKVAGHFPHCTEPPAFLSAQPADLFIDVDERHVLQKIKQGFLISFGSFE